MGYSNLLLEEKDNVLVIFLNRPSNMNSLDSATLNELLHVFEGINHTNTGNIRSIILTGKGKCFCAGADISQFKDISADKARAISELGHKTFNTIENTKIPVTAAVHGYALGGGLELALSCHIIVAESNAKIGLPEVNIGLIPGFGGTQRLTRLIGRQRAFELILNGIIVNSTRAYSIGLVNEVVESHLLMEHCLTLQESFKKKSSFSLSSAIDSINGHGNHTLDGFENEIEHFSNLFRFEDHKEGITAFLEKREPNYRK